jgi:two-component system cell cycle sensor histidine kinase/response regulator CckA
VVENTGVIALVVDDEPVDLTFIKHILEATLGMTVFTAASFYQAIEVFDAHASEITLLVTDVSLPGKTGIDLARAVLRKNRDLKILFTSGWVGAAALRAQEVPPNDRHFLPKPFRYSDLVEKVKEILRMDEPISWIEPNGDGPLAEGHNP